MRIIFLTLTLSIFGTCFLHLAGARAESPTMESELRENLSSDVIQFWTSKTHRHEKKALNDFFRSWYSERAFLPFWIDSGVVSGRALDLLQAVEAAYAEGLNPDDYFLPPIRERLNSTEFKSLAELEILLTLSAVTLSADARAGRLELRRIDAAEFPAAEFGRPELDSIMNEVLYRSDIRSAIAEQFPRHRQYQRLKLALAEYRSTVKAGAWTAVSANGAPLRLGSSGPRVLDLARRLRETGDLELSGAVEDKFGKALEQAVRDFQRRHGIPETGEVHQQTFAALKVTADERLNTLLINLERWRWLERDFTNAKEVFVNIAGFELFALESSKLVLRMPVIVGKAYHATPVFSGYIRQVEVNPYWNVPQSIAIKEILPKLKKDPRYLANEHMKLFVAGSGYKSELLADSINWGTVSPAQMRHYAIRQEPGEWNALGYLKFIFPNPYSVYLHDTASRGLFSRHDRALSHGCIRLSQPLDFAAFLLSTAEETWNTERVQKLITEGGHHYVKLPTPVLLHLTYRTAWVDSDGKVNFRPDIYQRDAKLLRVLK